MSILLPKLNDLSLASVFIYMIFITLTACSGNDSSKSDDANRNSVIPAVEAVKARYGSLPLSERLSGTVRAENQVVLSPEISGKIGRVYVQDGETVKKGAPLVKLQDDQYQEQYQQAKAGLNISKAQLQQAQSDLKRVKSQFGRIKSLRDKNLSSDQEFENLQSQVSSARADVELAQAQVEQARATMQQQQNQLSKTMIRAPIAGTVGQRHAEIGMQVTPSTQLFTIGNLGKVKIEVVLTDNMMHYIEVGQNAKVYVNNGSDDQTAIDASVARISPFLNDVTRSTEAELEVVNKEHLLKPGMFVPVDIAYGDSQQATLIPTSALYTDPTNGKEGVFVAGSIGLEIEPADSVNPDNPPPLTEPTQVQFKPVNVIARGRMQAGISGIKSGQWVITVGQDLLSEGHPRARVRTVSWNRIYALQGLQRQDLLKKVLDEQNKGESPS